MQTRAQTTFRRLPAFGESEAETQEEEKDRDRERETERERGGRVGISLRGTTNGHHGDCESFSQGHGAIL